MATAEIAYTKSPVYTFDFPALAPGTTSSTIENASIIANFSPACSKILGLSLVSGTGVGPVGAYVKAPGVTAGSLFPTIVLSSNNNTDNAVYRMYFVNEVAQSPYLTIHLC